MASDFEYDSCAASLRDLSRDVAVDDDLSRYRLAITQGMLAVQHDDSESMNTIVRRLLEAPSDIDSVGLGGRNNILSWHYMHLGDFEAARAVQTRSPALLVNGQQLLGTPAGTLYGRCVMGLSYSMEGRFVQAERICRDVLDDADRLGSEAVEASCLATAVLGEVLYEFNEVEAAKQLLQERVDVLERISIPDSVLRVLTVLSAVQWAAGHHLDAFAWLERLEEYGTKYRLKRLIAHSLAEQVRRHLQVGRFSKAQSTLDRLQSLAQGIDIRHPGTRAHVCVQARWAAILWDIAHRDHDRASMSVVSLVSACEAHGWQRYVVHLQLLGAVVDARVGRMQAAAEAIVTALRWGHRLGLTRSVLDVDPAVLDLIQEVVQAQPADPVLSFYVGRLQTAQSAMQMVRESGTRNAAERRLGERSADLPLSEREFEVVQLLAQAMPNKRIAKTLAISPETVKWHLKNIYGKLDVASRDEAVARIRDLNLTGATIRVGPDDAH